MKIGPTRLLATALAALITTAAVCPPRFFKAFTDAVPTQAQHDELVQATKSIGEIRDAAFRGALERFASDVVDAFENPVAGIPEPAFKRTLEKLAHFLAGPADGRYTTDHLRRALLAVDGLRDNGVPFAGLVERAGTPSSSAWLTTVNNRGHLFEVIAAKRLLDDGLVSAPQLRGFGFTVPTLSGTLEGDLVSRLATGGEHWFDFKAAGGVIDLNQIAKAEAALRDGLIRRFTFAYETGQAPTDPIVIQALADANSRLVSRGRQIELIDAGAN